MKKLITFLLLLQTGLLSAQNIVLSGLITFERKENMHKLFKDDNSWTEERLKHMPKYKTDQFTLTFNTTNSFYKLLEEDENPAFMWVKVAHANSVWMDQMNNKLVADKTVYDGEYRIEDSIPSYSWKMLGEFRDIAGYSCRKAATIIFDSIYVIAFYTDQIPVSAGPESFTGLPGMILGIVAPRMNLTWFATKVEPQQIKPETFVVKNSRRKKHNQQTFKEEIRKAFEEWGSYGAWFGLRARM